MLLVSAVTCGLLLADARAPAERAASIHWRAPAQCPTAEVAAARAQALGVRDTTADVHIVEVPGGFAAEVVTDTRRRRLRSASCDELATAVALLLVAGMDEPSAIEPEPAVPASTEPELGDPVEPARPESEVAAVDRGSLATPTPTVPRPRARTDLLGPTLAVWGTIGVGLLPRIDAGGGASVGWRWRRILIDLGGWALAPTERVLDTGVRGRILLGAAAITVCGRLRRAWFEARPCGGFEAGGTRVRTSGSAVQPQASNVWLGVRGSLRMLAWFHPRIAPVVSVGAVVPVFRTDYRVGDAVLISTAPVAFSTTLGVEVALGRAR